MQKPYLKIIAGCNGSGKSTYSQTYESTLIPFDFDKKFLKQYRKMSDSELRYEMAQRIISNEFESSIEGAFLKGHSFCYETNFDTNPIYWAEKAKNHGYALEIIFFCLDSLDTAKSRVLDRTRRNGHFVDAETVFYKWKEGYNNLNIHYNMFDRILLLDNTSSDGVPKNYCSLIKNKAGSFDIHNYNILPRVYKRRLPKVYRLVRPS